MNINNRGNQQNSYHTATIFNIYTHEDLPAVKNSSSRMAAMLGLAEGSERRRRWMRNLAGAETREWGTWYSFFLIR